MANKSITIIVPVYNVEQYLAACLESLANQTCLNFSVLLVDDGSTDNSSTIATAYANKNSNLFTYLNKENGGLSDARNFGINKVTSEYVMFVDSDDIIELDTIEVLNQSLQENDVDILCFGMTEVSEHGEHIRNIPATTANFSNTSLNETPNIITDALPNACNKVIRTSLFNEHDIFFPKGLWYEDLATIPKLYQVANVIGFEKACLYHYRTRSGSITQTVSPKVLDMIKVLHELDNYFDRSSDNAIHKALDTLTLNMLTKTLVRIASHNNAQEQEKMLLEVQCYLKTKKSGGYSVFSNNGKNVYKIIIWLTYTKLNRILLTFLKFCLKRGLVRA